MRRVGSAWRHAGSDRRRDTRARIGVETRRLGSAWGQARSGRAVRGNSSTRRIIATRERAKRWPDKFASSSILSQAAADEALWRDAWRPDSHNAASRLRFARRLAVAMRRDWRRKPP